MTVTLDTFLDFVESTPLEQEDGIRIENLISQVMIETNGFPGLCDDDRQDLAVSLYVAHILTVEKREDSLSKFGGGTPVKKIEGKNEKLEFAQEITGRYDLDQTTYGTRLASLLHSNRNVAFWASGC